MNSAYDGKYKACDPQKTVHKIRRMLWGRNMATEEIWVHSGVGTISSLRVNIKGTQTGQNGKGTDSDFARASGYAELMERLQTGFLLPEKLSRMKGRRWLDREEIKAEGGTLLRDTMLRLGQTCDEAGQPPREEDAFLDAWSFENDRNGRMACIPFQRADNGKTEYIPELLLRTYYYTNGSCAGNCREEAFIQGMSEICERYAMVSILRKRLTPPLIPDGAFAPWPLLKNAVDEIRAGGRYDLRLMDASCGLSLPVVCSALTDRETGKMVIRFGAHPKFEIALERCLTETLQGRHLGKLEFTPVYDFRNDEKATEYVNAFQLLKIGSGTFPAEFFLDAPSWPYRPFEETPDALEGQLAFLNVLYQRLGWVLYVRDCTVEGFHVYQLLVPGVSMVFDFGPEKLRERKELSFFRERMNDLQALSDAELARVRDLALYRSRLTIEDRFPALCGLPITPRLLGVEMDAGVLAAVCCMALGETARAAELLRPCSFDANGKMTGIYPLVQLLEGRDSDRAFAMMRIVCPEGWAEEARRMLRNPRAALSAVSDRENDQSALFSEAVHFFDDRPGW